MRRFTLRDYRPEAEEESLNALMASMLYTPGAIQVQYRCKIARRSNLSVGLTLDMMIYRADSFDDSG